MSGPDLLLDTSNSRDVVLQVRARGRQILRNPIANRGTAFTLSERERLDLSGLLPSRVTTMEEQLRRTYAQYSRSPSPLAKFIYLSQLRDRNEVLFYRLLSENIEEMLPIVYTPVVAEACQQFSHIYRRPRGLFIPYDMRDSISELLRNRPNPDVDVVVVTDGERILGAHLGRDVGDLRDEVPDRPAVVAHASHRQVAVYDGPVRAQVALAKAIRIPRPGEHLANKLQVDLQIVRMRQLLPRRCGERLLVAPQ